MPAATLPEGLTPDPDSIGHGIALFIDWQYNASRNEYLDPLRSQYHEFFVLLDACWQDTPVSWLSHHCIRPCSLAEAVPWPARACAGLP